MIKPCGVCGAWPEADRGEMRDTIARLPPKEQRVCHECFLAWWRNLVEAVEDLKTTRH
jgi:hypothetical protein